MPAADELTKWALSKNRKWMAAEQATGRAVQLNRPRLRKPTNWEHEGYTGVACGLATSSHKANLPDLGAVDAAVGAPDAISPPAAQVGPAGACAGKPLILCYWRRSAGRCPRPAWRSLLPRPETLLRWHR